MSGRGVRHPWRALPLAAVAFLAACSFEGIRSTDAPPSSDPDVQIAVGPSHIVEVAGGLLRMFAKTPEGEITTTGLTVAR